MSSFSQIDTGLLQGYLDNLGADVVEQMLDLYAQQSTIYIKDIEQTITDESQTDWQESCHKMKGAAGSVGLTNVHATLASIEKSTELWAEKSKQLATLATLNKESIDSFSQWLANNR